MTRVKIHEQKELSWYTLRSFLKPEEMAKFTAGELDSQARIHEMGTEDSPQLFESQFPPHGEVNIHAHAEDEIMFVLAGQMLVGNRTLGPGSSVFIAGNTLYSFKAGPEGLTFLNFRPRKDTTYITPEEFQEQRRRKRAAP